MVHAMPWLIYQHWSSTTANTQGNNCCLKCKHITWYVCVHKSDHSNVHACVASSKSIVLQVLSKTCNSYGHWQLQMVKCYETFLFRICTWIFNFSGITFNFMANRHRFGTIEIDNITLSDASLYGQLLYTNYKVFGTFWKPYTIGDWSA